MAARKSGGFITRASGRDDRSLTVAAQNDSAHFFRTATVRKRLLLLFAIATLSAQTPPLKEFNHKKHLKLANVAPVIAAATANGKYLAHGERIRPVLNSTTPCFACPHRLEAS